MRHVACLGLVMGSVVLSFWGCGGDGSTTGSTGAEPIPCETERDCVDETNPCRRGFCFDKVCEMQDIDNGEQPGADQIDGDRAPPAARDVELARARAFAVHAHHVGAHVGEQHAGERSRPDAGELDNLDPSQRTLRHVFSP